MVAVEPSSEHDGLTASVHANYSWYCYVARCPAEAAVADVQAYMDQVVARRTRDGKAGLSVEDVLGILREIKVKLQGYAAFQGLRV